LGFGFTCWRSVRWIRLNDHVTNIWPLAYLAFLFLANLTESSLLRQNSLWVLYVAATLTIAQRQTIGAEGLRPQNTLSFPA
jgi:exopolysaccharide production protein ExoQ